MSTKPRTALTRPTAEVPSGNLDGLRRGIDDLDGRIVDLLNQRAALAVEIGKLKETHPGGVYAPDRESAVYARLEGCTDGPLPPESLKSIFREIMSASLALERPLRVAYLGPEATHTHLAAISRFGESVHYEDCARISDVFNEVAHKRADYGIVPVENSSEGAVTYSLDMFADSELKICAEIVTDIHHHLLSNSAIRDIRTLYTNPQVLGQCRGWIERHVPRAELVETPSTTDAARRAAREEGAGAIASRLAGTLYGLQILAESIQDASHNQTRFLVLGRTGADPTGRDKTSLLLSLRDSPGALHEAIEPFRRHGVNLTKIESRPSKRKAWEYHFFIDLAGHAADDDVRRALAEVEDRSRHVKVLGSYPADPESAA